MAEPTERWLPVVGYEGSYEVSDLGRVRSTDRITDRGRKWRGRIMKPSRMSSGYLQVTFWRNGKQSSHLVHRVVLTAFIGPAEHGIEALHGPGGTADNSLTNLAWGTHSQNQYDQVNSGTHPHASKDRCPAGHPYDETNTYIYPGRAHRGCRICRRAHSRKRAAA